MEPLELEDGSFIAFTLDEATAALAFLVEQGMVVVDGDQVLIPPRFVDAFYHPSGSWPGYQPAARNRWTHQSPSGR
jgi:hypothetical protein